jgi:hypothetical protein
MQEYQTPRGYDRVRAHSAEVVNTRIDRITESNLRRATEHAGALSQRLGELDREWEIDRAIMIAFAGMGVAALSLGLRRDWRWRLPLGAQVVFLLLHSIVGWSPQAAVLRRLGFRTRQEIDGERQELLATTHRVVVPTTG